MKKLMLILFFSSLCLAQLLPSDEDLAMMSSFEKQMLYEKKDKSPIGAVALNCLLPTVGYAYINDWKRGLKFLGVEILLVGTGNYLTLLDDADCIAGTGECGGMVENLGIGMMITAGILKLYEYIDVYRQTNKYNERLHNKIFQKDNNLSFLILPTSNGAYLNLSYKF